MLKVLLGVDHAQAPHYGLRGQIELRSEGDNLIQIDILEGEAQGLLGGLSGVALTPMLLGKAVPNLYAWHEGQRPSRNAEAHEANEGPRVLDFYRPVAPATFDQFRGPNVNASVTRLAGLGRGEETHDLRIRA